MRKKVKFKIGQVVAQCIKWPKEPVFVQRYGSIMEFGELPNGNKTVRFNEGGMSSVSSTLPRDGTRIYIRPLTKKERGE